MATNFPGSIDNSTSLPYPSSGNFTNGPSLAGGQDNQNDAIIATQTKLGSGASTPTNNNLLIGTGTGTSAWSKAAPAGVIVGTTDSQTLTNKILTSPTINSPVISNANITADIVSGFTSANSGTIYGIAVASGAITGANTVNGSAIVAGGIGSTQLASSSVTAPKIDFTTLPNFSATFSGSQAMSGTATTITVNTTAYNVGSGFNTSTFTFTAPVAGNYEFYGFAASSNGASARLILNFLVNGTTSLAGTQQTDTFSSGIVYAGITMAAGNTIVLQGSYNPSTSGNITLARFMGRRVS